MLLKVRKKTLADPEHLVTLERLGIARGLARVIYWVSTPSRIARFLHQPPLVLPDEI